MSEMHTDVDGAFCSFYPSFWISSESLRTQSEGAVPPTPRGQCGSEEEEEEGLKMAEPTANLLQNSWEEIGREFKWEFKVEVAAEVI